MIEHIQKKVKDQFASKAELLSLKKYKPTFDKIKSEVDKQLDNFSKDIPDLPFKIPEFKIGKINVDLNDKEKISEVLQDTKKVLNSEPVQNILKFVGLG